MHAYRGLVGYPLKAQAGKVYTLSKLTLCSADQRFGKGHVLGLGVAKIAKLEQRPVFHLQV